MNETPNVSINGKLYMVNNPIKAIREGYLVPIPEYPLEPGDVYVDLVGHFNPLLLVQVIYENFYDPNVKSTARYQLLGMGCRPNSNDFYFTVHTKKEIEEYLLKQKLVFSHNIESDMSKLVMNKKG